VLSAATDIQQRETASSATDIQSRKMVDPRQQLGIVPKEPEEFQ